MVTFQVFNVLDLEGFNEQFVQPEQRQRVVNIEAQREGPDEIFASLETAAFRGSRGSLEIEERNNA